MVPAKLALALTLFPVGSRFLPARAKRGWPPKVNHSLPAPGTGVESTYAPVTGVQSNDKSGTSRLFPIQKITKTIRAEPIRALERAC